MATYRVLWKASAALLVAVGCMAALFLVPLSVDAILFAMTMGICGSIKYTVNSADDKPCPAAVRNAARTAVAVAAATVAICGYAAAAGVLTVTLVALTLATSPPVASRLLRQPTTRTDAARRESAKDDVKVTDTASHSNAADATTDDGRPASESAVLNQQPHAVGDMELCRRWRRSYLCLQRATSIDERLRIVALRQSYLDEFERRAPDKLADWLHTGARAAGDPTRFICRDAHRRN